jgi:hypothetical protein
MGIDKADGELALCIYVKDPNLSWPRSAIRHTFRLAQKYGRVPDLFTRLLPAYLALSGITRKLEELVGMAYRQTVFSVGAFK